MPDRRGERSSAWARLVALGVCTALVGFAALYLRSAAREAAVAVEASRARLEEDRALAERYRRAAPERPVVCANIEEAQSSEFIESALRANGLTYEEIVYGDPEKPGEMEGQFEKVETTIRLKETTLSSLVGFLREVEQGRPQLRLVGASLPRTGQADRWRGWLKYRALIPAKPRR